MSDIPTPTDAIRTLLFRKAETLNQRLLERLADVADHLSKRKHRAAIGALAGLEADIATICSFMVLVQDTFEPDFSEGGKD
jgi:hypothetical protein